MKWCVADCGLQVERESAPRRLTQIRLAHFTIRSRPSRQFAISRSPRHGWSLVEITVAVAVIGILAAWAVPSFRRTVELSRADIAAANLRAIWSAERLYWLDYRTYSADLTELQSLGLIDPTIVASTAPYSYAIASATDTALLVTATRAGSSVWTGQYAIDETGAVTGVVSASGQPDLVPGFN